jgi:hypothetical protein
MSFGDKQTATQQSQQTDPWAPAIPSLMGLLGKANNISTSVTPAQTAAFSTLQQNAAQGDPNAAADRNLSTNMLDSQSWSPVATNAYGNMQGSLGDIANMNVDPTQSPGMAGVLATIRNDISNQVNGQFAAAGRDMSGMNQQTLARGIAQGEAQPLLNQYNQNVANKTAAATALQQAGLNTATAGQGLDAANYGVQQGGIGVGQEALAAQNYAPNAMLQLQQQQQQLPFTNLGMLASLLYPMAGLGGQSTGQGTSNTTSTGIGASFNPFSWLGGK